MADLKRGRPVQDKNNVGGLRAAYLLAYDESKYNGGLDPTFDATNTQTIQSFADLEANESWFKLDLQGTSTADEALTASRENGTIMTEGTLSLNFKKTSATDLEDIYDIATGRYFVLIEQKGPEGSDGILRLFGLHYGCDVDTAGTTSGAAQADGSNFTLSLKSMEPRPANFTDSGALWVAGKQGSLEAADIITGQTINDVDGSGT